MMKQVRHRFTVLAIAGAATVAMLPALAGQLAHGSDRLDGRQVQATRVGRWIHTGPNLTPPVQALGVDPSRPSTLYAGSPSGVAKTVDAGKTWRPSSQGLTNTDVRALAIDPSRPSTIYAGTADSTGGDAVFKSTDGARTWVAASLGLPPGAVITALAIDPTIPSTLYAGNDGAGRQHTSPRTEVIPGCLQRGASP